MVRGRFITLEGGEGAGKSTQTRLLAERLSGRGIDSLLTREPGGTEGAEAIRGLIVDGSAERWRPLAELYLFLAAREDHLHRAILPALAAGRWVLCDRFADSSRVYQGIAGELGLDLVDRLQEPLLGINRPDLTLVLDLPVATGLARCAARGGAGRFEAKGATYHERVREGFCFLAGREPERFAMVDASGAEEEVAAAVWRMVCQRLGLGRP
ncbi:MAG: dTMP kinase [Geminicoccaceae bacterium]